MADEDLQMDEAPDTSADTPVPGEATLATRAQQQWATLGSTLTTPQKVSIGLITALVLVGLLAMVGLASNTDWQPVFTKLDVNDASAITSQLDGQRIPYKLEANGTAILVPSARVDEVRISMASQGFPKGGNVGFELFDNSDPWSGRREHEVRARRALEGELARTIGRIEGVSAAKVHLALPEESLFIEKDRPPTASVMIDLLPGRTLLSGHVEAIQRLVSAGVEGLEMGNVEVVDSRGELLSTAADADGKNDALEFQKKLERTLEKQALHILEPIVGRGRTQVKVNADVDFSKITERIELLDDEKVVVSHESRTSEKRDPLAAGPGGVPGARAPAAEGLQPVGGGMSTERKQEDISYSVPKTTRTVEVPVGTIRRLSIAVIVDGSYKKGAAGEDEDGVVQEYVARTDDELARFTALVKKSVGFDERRGDQFEMVNEQFAAGVEAAGPSVIWLDLVRSLTPWLVALLIALMLVIFGVRPLVKFATEQPEPDMPVLTADEAERVLVEGGQASGGGRGGPPALMGEDGMLVAADEDEDELLAGLIAGGQDPSKVIREFARQEPARTAQVLRRWLAKG